MEKQTVEEFQKNEIKKALLQGGLVIHKRGSGKSTAIAEILAEDPYAVAVVRHEATRQVLIKLGAKPSQIVFASHLESSLLFGQVEDKRLYGDELTLAQIESLMGRREFHAAVTSVNFPIRVLK